MFANKMEELWKDIHGTVISLYKLSKKEIIRQPKLLKYYGDMIHYYDNDTIGGNKSRKRFVSKRRGIKSRRRRLRRT
jgi:hypothetical protein